MEKISVMVIYREFLAQVSGVRISSLLLNLVEAVNKKATYSLFPESMKDLAMEDGIN